METPNSEKVTMVMDKVFRCFMISSFLVAGSDAGFVVVIQRMKDYDSKIPTFVSCN